MNIKIGIYDIFAHALPGGAYVFVITYILKLANVVTIEFEPFNISLSQFLLLGALSYIVGLLFDWVSRALWYRFFARYKKDNMSDVSYEEMKRRYHRYNFSFQHEEWPILLANITDRSIDMATEIKKFNAMHIMLRNISFALLILFLIALIQVFREGFLLIHILTSIFSLLFSLIAVKRAMLFEKYFYNMIFEATIAHSTKLLDTVDAEKNSTVH
jgi:hypothetical protein